MQLVKRLASNLLQTNDWEEQFHDICAPDLEAAEQPRPASPFEVRRAGPRLSSNGVPSLGRMSLRRQSSSNGGASSDAEALPYVPRARRTSYMADGSTPTQAAYMWQSVDLPPGFSQVVAQQHQAVKSTSPRYAAPAATTTPARDVEGGRQSALTINDSLTRGGSGNISGGSAGGAAPTAGASYPPHDSSAIAVNLTPTSPAGPYQPTHQRHTDDDVSCLPPPPMNPPHTQHQPKQPSHGADQPDPDTGQPPGPSPAHYRLNPARPKYPPVVFPTLEVTTHVDIPPAYHPDPLPEPAPAHRAKASAWQTFFGLGRKAAPPEPELPVVITTMDTHQQPAPAGLPPRHRRSGAGKIPGPPPPMGAGLPTAAGLRGGPLARPDYNLAGSAQSFTGVPRPRLSSGGCSRMVQARIDYSELQLIREIGEGGFGKVYQAMWRGSIVAVKVATVDRGNKTGTREFDREMSTMSGIPIHQNVLKLLATCNQPPQLALVTEYCARGSLYGLLHNPNSAPMNWRQLLLVCQGVARGMQHLHNNKVLHRDLKSANILLDDMGAVKICDFGLSKVSSGGQAYTGGLGTHQWMAPEVLVCQVYSNKADVFSYAIVVWECLTRKLPYEGMQAMQAAMSVVNQGLRPPIPPTTPTDLTVLIQSCWAPVADQRPSFQVIASRMSDMLTSWSDVLLRQTVPGWLKDQTPEVPTPAPVLAPTEPYATAVDAPAAVMAAQHVAAPLPDQPSGGHLTGASSHGGSTATVSTDLNHSAGHPGGVVQSPGAPTMPAMPAMSRPVAIPAAAAATAKPAGTYDTAVYGWDAKGTPPAGNTGVTRNSGPPLGMPPPLGKPAEPHTPVAAVRPTQTAAATPAPPPVAGTAMQPGPAAHVAQPVSPRPPTAAGNATGAVGPDVFPSPLGPMAMKAWTDRPHSMWERPSMLTYGDVGAGTGDSWVSRPDGVGGAGIGTQATVAPGAVCVVAAPAPPTNHRGGSWKS